MQFVEREKSHIISVQWKITNSIEMWWIKSVVRAIASDFQLVIFIVHASSFQTHNHYSSISHMSIISVLCAQSWLHACENKNSPSSIRIANSCVWSIGENSNIWLAQRDLNVLNSENAFEMQPVISFYWNYKHILITIQPNRIDFIGITCYAVN